MKIYEIKETEFYAMKRPKEQTAGIASSILTKTEDDDLICKNPFQFESAAVIINLKKVGSQEQSNNYAP